MRLGGATFSDDGGTLRVGTRHGTALRRWIPVGVALGLLLLLQPIRPLQFVGLVLLFGAELFYLTVEGDARSRRAGFLVIERELSVSRTGGSYREAPGPILHVDGQIVPAERPVALVTQTPGAKNVPPGHQLYLVTDEKVVEVCDAGHRDDLKAVGRALAGALGGSEAVVEHRLGESPGTWVATLSVLLQLFSAIPMIFLRAPAALLGLLLLHVALTAGGMALYVTLQQRHRRLVAELLRALATRPRGVG